MPFGTKRSWWVSKDLRHHFGQGSDFKFGISVSTCGIVTKNIIKLHILAKIGKCWHVCLNNPDVLKSNFIIFVTWHCPHEGWPIDHIRVSCLKPGSKWQKCRHFGPFGTKWLWLCLGTKTISDRSCTWFWHHIWDLVFQVWQGDEALTSHWRRCSLLGNRGMRYIVRNVLGCQTQILYYLWPTTAHKGLWL